jgi:anthranilate synthase component 2
VAWTDEPGFETEIQAVRHREHPVWGVQFHPESIASEHGHALLRNFLELG